MANDLLKKKCVPCEGGVKPFSPDEIQKYMSELQNNWEVLDNKKLSYQFEFESFSKAIEFVNRVAKLAEEEGHHPDIHVHYKKVVIETWTHAIGGLSENDFILAAKIENLLRE